MPDTTPTPAPVPDPALVQRAAQALHAAGGPFTNADPETLAAAVLAELAPELAELLDYRNRITWETTCGEHARLLTACRAADERAEQAEAALAESRAIITDLTDPDPCSYDHHGYCQAHGYLAIEPTCPHARAKALTPTADTPKEPTT